MRRESWTDLTLGISNVVTGGAIAIVVTLKAATEGYVFAIPSRTGRWHHRTLRFGVENIVCTGAL